MYLIWLFNCPLSQRCQNIHVFRNKGELLHVEIHVLWKSEQLRWFFSLMFSSYASVVQLIHEWIALLWVKCCYGNCTPSVIEYNSGWNEVCKCLIISQMFFFVLFCFSRNLNWTLLVSPSPALNKQQVYSRVSDVKVNSRHRLNFSLVRNILFSCITTQLQLWLDLWWSSLRLWLRRETGNASARLSVEDICYSKSLSVWDLCYVVM